MSILELIRQKRGFQQVTFAPQQVPQIRPPGCSILLKQFDRALQPHCTAVRPAASAHRTAETNQDTAAAIAHFPHHSNDNIGKRGMRAGHKWPTRSTFPSQLPMFLSVDIASTLFRWDYLAAQDATQSAGELPGQPQSESEHAGSSFVAAPQVAVEPEPGSRYELF